MVGARPKSARALSLDAPALTWLVRSHSLTERARRWRVGALALIWHLFKRYTFYNSVARMSARKASRADVGVLPPTGAYAGAAAGGAAAAPAWPAARNPFAAGVSGAYPEVWKGPDAHPG